jgi:hypothetical protein
MTSFSSASAEDNHSRVTTYVLSQGIQKKATSKDTPQHIPILNEINLPKIKINLDINKEKPDSLTSSDILAFLALIFSASSLGFTIWSYNSSKSQSIKETFWMREVLIPRFLNKFFEFIQSAPECYKASNNLGDFYTTYALVELNLLRDASSILSAGHADLGANIKDVIEKFEDEVMAISTYDDLTALITKFAVQVVKVIQSAQRSIN